MPMMPSLPTSSRAAAAAAAALSVAAILSSIAKARRRRRVLRTTMCRSIPALESEGSNAMSPWAHAVVSYASGSGRTLESCRASFDSIRLLPRIMTGGSGKKGEREEVGSGADASVELFGSIIGLPVLVAPTSHHRTYCPGGEAETARGAGLAGAGYCYNFLLADSHYSEVEKERGVKWLHLYLNKDESMIRKAIELCCSTGGKNKGTYDAILLTCDHPHDRVQKAFGAMFREWMFTFRFWINMLSNLNEPLYGNQKDIEGDARTFLQITLQMMFGGKLSKVPNSNEDSESSESLGLDWASVRKVKSMTDLPIVVKGVLSPADAFLAVEAGVDGIVVSNHGGRQVDGTVAAIDALPAVVAAVDGKVPVFVDTGVRTSADVVKALCLGARAVLLGRPPLWALAAGGGEALRVMLESMKEDIEADMMSLGVKTVNDLGLDFVWPPDRERICDSVRACGIVPNR